MLNVTDTEFEHTFKTKDAYVYSCLPTSRLG